MIDLLVKIFNKGRIRKGTYNYVIIYYYTALYLLLLILLYYINITFNRFRYIVGDFH